MRISSRLVACLCALFSGASSAQPADGEPEHELVVLVCSMGSASARPLTESEELDERRRYLSRLDEENDARIEEIAALLPSEKVRALRDEHLQWMRGRDDYCGAIGRSSTDAFAELECLASLAGAYYDQREEEIVHLEEERE